MLNGFALLANLGHSLDADLQMYLAPLGGDMLIGLGGFNALGSRW